MNDNDIAMACKKDTKHLIQNGKDGFDVTLVLCSDRFKIISQKIKIRGFSFSRFIWERLCAMIVRSLLGVVLFAAAMGLILIPCTPYTVE